VLCLGQLAIYRFGGLSCIQGQTNTLLNILYVTSFLCYPNDENDDKQNEDEDEDEDDEITLYNMYFLEIYSAKMTFYIFWRYNTMTV
jgi:hypothetical protein